MEDGIGNRAKAGVMIFWAIAITACAQSGEQIAQQALSSSGITAGLAVCLGSTDGHAEGELAKSGRILVHGLSTDNAAIDNAREYLRAQSLYGLASIDKIKSYATLPYADNMANLLIADLGTLGSSGLTEGEALRVVVPNGKAYLKKNGSWTVTTKPMPSGMDAWPHWDYGPEMNPVSHDSRVKVPTSAKWLAWYGSYAGNGTGLNGQPRHEFRINGGRASQYLQYKDLRDNSFLDVRDAFNGVALWTKKQNFLVSKASRYVLTENLMVTHLTYGRVASRVHMPGGPLLALNAATGDTARVLTGAGLANSAGVASQIIEVGGAILCAVRDTITSVNPATGAINWQWMEPGHNALSFPAASAKDNVCFLGVLKDSVCSLDGRMPHGFVKAVVCLNLSTGQQKWRCDSYAGKGGGNSPYPLLSQLAYDNNGHLAMFGDNSYGDPFLGMIRTSDGAFLWCHHYQMDTTTTTFVTENINTNTTTTGLSYWGKVVVTCDPIYGWTSLFREGYIWVLSKDRAFAYDILTGARTKRFKASLLNNRCNRAFATDSLFIMGFGSFVNKDFSWSHTNISRSSCGGGITPAYGQLFTGPNGQCGCFTRIRNALSTCAEPLRPDVNDSSRLEKGEAYSQALSSKASGGTNELDNTYFAPVAPVISGNPLKNDWGNNDYTPGAETAPTDVDGKGYVAVVNEHRVECRSGGAVVWSYTVGSRVSRQPILREGKVFFAGHDGYVYCLRADNGKLIWRFLAARADRRIVAFSQIESASPAFGITIHNGKVCASAGRHPELDGGIYAWGLEPATGGIAWKTVIRTKPQLVDAASKYYSKYVNTTVNGVMKNDSTGLKLSGVLVVPGKTAVVPPAGSSVAPNAVSPAIRAIANGVIVYPGKAFAAPLQCTLTDIRGRTILTHDHYQGTSTMIPTSYISRGTYLLSAVDAAGKSFSAKVTIK